MASDVMAEAVAQQAAKLNFQQVEQMQVSCESCMMLQLPLGTQFVMLWNMQLQSTPADACKSPEAVPPKEWWLDCI